MALITRVSRLFRADLHAVLDRLEEPDVVLRQAVREMEEEVARDDRRLKLMGAELRQLSVREADVSRTERELDEELDICFASDADELARAIVKRKLEARRLEKVLAAKREGLESGIAALDSRLRENRSELEAMRQKSELLSEDDTPAGRDGPPGAGIDTAVRAEDVEVAFLREKQRRQPS